jgi:Protein of unknown function (DUF2800)
MVAPIKKSHTSLSPSNADRWMHCPGSVELCAQMPKPEQSAYAGEGEAAHTLLERCLKNPKILPWDMVGTAIGDFEVDDEMAEAVSFALEVIRAEAAKGGEVLIETKVEIAPGISGTLDVAIIRPYDSLTVIDFKYGKGIVVSAVDNVQLLLYGLPLSIQAEVKDIKLVVIQPRTDGQVSTWTCDSDYMATFATEVNRKIALTKEPKALVSAGTWCKFCWAKPICPALRQKISDALPAIPEKQVLFPNVKGLSVQTVKKILDYRDLIEEWLSAVAAYAQEVAEAGGEIPGYELAQKRANRRWKDEVAALQAFDDLGEKAYKVKLLSPAQMEKIAGKDRVAPLTEVPDNGKTLKRVKETTNVKELL